MGALRPPVPVVGLILIATVIMRAAASAATPTINVTEQLYEIEGSDVATLRAQMAERGPYSDRAEGHVPARMEAKVGFHFSARRSQHGGCRLNRIRVNADITYHFPRWTGVVEASMYLAEKWSLYLARLRIHEAGHGQMVIDAAHEVVATLEATGRWKRCDQLRATARARAESILRRMKQAQADYDAQTGGGETQGAVLRENPDAVVN